MNNEIEIKKFDEIYNNTYHDILRYVICKCKNMDDVNEIVQDIYLELYNILSKKPNLKLDNETFYIIGIAKNILRKYYRGKYKENSNILYFSKEFEDSNIEIISDTDLEAEIITKDNVEKIWNYLNKKNILIAKVFYLYYALGLKISEIALELEISEQTVKNYIYRTLKDLKEKFGKEV